LEAIKEEAQTTNEEMRVVQRGVFCILNNIQRNMDDQMKLTYQMEEMRSKYQRAQDAI
jgi:hypothetical protein